MANKGEETVRTKAVKYSKEKILATLRYKGRVDLLGVLLKNGKSYTFEEVDKIIENFMKGANK